MDGSKRGKPRSVSVGSQRESAEGRLRWLERAVEQSIDGIAVADLEGSVQFVNPAWAQMHGYGVTELMGKHLNIFHTEEQLQKEVILFNEQVKRTGSHQGEVGHVRKDGTTFPTWMTSTLLRDKEGNPIGLVGIARDITERKQAEEALRTRERFLECLSEVSQQLLRAGDLAEALPAVLRRLGETAEVSRVYFFENHPGPEGALLCNQRYEWCAPGVEPQIDNPELQNFPYVAAGFARWVEVLGQGGVIAGAVADFPESERATLEPQDIRSILVIPLFVSDNWYGFIGFDVCDRVREWQQVEIDLLRAAASASASAVEREQANRQAQALVEATAALTTTLDFEQVLDHILEQVNRVVPNDAANVMLIEGDQVRIVRWCGYERFGAEEFVSTVVFHISEVPNLQQMVETGEPMVIPDTTTYQDWVHVPVQEWLRSYAAAPIVVRGEVIGFLNVDSATPGFFTLVHAESLRAFADHAAAAIANARLFKQAQRRLQSLASLNQASQVIAASLDVKEVLEQIVSLAGSVVNSDYTSVILLDEEGKPLRGTEDFRGMPPILQRIRSRGVSHHVLDSGQPVVVDDISSEGAMSPPLRRSDGELMKANPVAVAAGIRSFAAAPILAKERTMGVLFVHSRQPHTFHGQLPLLTTFANQAAIAIENARLYEEAQRRVRELTLLNRISAGLGVGLNVDSTINHALEGLQELVGADRTYFVTANPEARTWETTHELVAPGIEPDIGLNGTFDDVPVELETLLSGQPFAVSDIATDPRVKVTRERYRSLGMQSMLLVPVQVRRRFYGAMGFDYCREKHAWRPDEIRLLETVAHQLELALDNMRLFEEARLRAEELAAALARQEELDRLKNQFIQNVSHELRSPLALIRGYAEMLSTGELGEIQPDQQQPVAVISRRAHMLGDLVRDITLILEAEVDPPKPGPVPLDELARAAVEDFQVATRQAELILHADIAPHLPPVSSSHTYMRRVLDNLIGNAVKFTPAGGTITVRLRQEGKQVVLEVSDTGIGVPADQLERIFERFYQVDGSSRRKYGGVGLGLALVKEIAEAYGGRVTVESQVGEGSTFTVWLPVATGSETGPSDEKWEIPDNEG